MTHAGNRVREMVSVDPSLSLSSQSAFKVAYTFNLANRVLKTVTVQAPARIRQDHDPRNAARAEAIGALRRVAGSAL